MAGESVRVSASGFGGCMAMAFIQGAGVGPGSAVERRHARQNQG